MVVDFTACVTAASVMIDQGGCVSDTDGRILPDLYTTVAGEGLPGSRAPLDREPTYVRVALIPFQVEKPLVRNK